MDQRRADQPGHERGVLHRIPEPPAAPAELVVGPPAAERDADGLEHPREDGPGPRPLAPRSDRAGPRASPRRRTRTPRRSRRSRCRASADESRARSPAAPDSNRAPSGAAGIRRRKGFEVQSVNSRKPQLTRPITPSTRREKLGGSWRLNGRDRHAPDRQHQDPQQQRALVRAPQRRHPVEQRQVRVGIVRHVEHREIVVDEANTPGTRTPSPRTRTARSPPGAPRSSSPACRATRRRDRRTPATGSAEGEDESEYAEFRCHVMFRLA